MAAQLDDDFVVDADNAKSRWAVVAMCAGMTAVCVALVIWGGLVGLVGGLPGVVFFGAICLPYIVFRAVRPASQLIVSTDGFTVKQYALDAGFIGWRRCRASRQARLPRFRG